MTTLTTPSDLVAVMGIAFSDEQLAAITAPMAPGVIVAGAGTGKTTVIAARVVWLAGCGVVAPERVLGLTFTRKAAAELSHRVRAALDRLGVAETGYPDVMTYDAFAGRLMAEFGAWAGLASPRLISDAEAYLNADQVVRSLPAPPGRLADRRLPQLIDDVVQLDRRRVAHLVTDEALEADAQRFRAALEAAPRNRGALYKGVREALETVDERADLLDVVRAFHDMKVRLGAMDFPDQMAAAVGLAYAYPMVGERLRARYGLVVVDEYQDTSPAQATLLGGLFGAAGGVADYPVTAVGDPMQAIYTWRGAAADSLGEFDEVFAASRPRRYPLTINRRSGQAILTVANAIAAPGTLVPGDGAPEASVTVREFETAAEEADWVAETLVAAHRTGGRWDGTAVLARRNRDLAPVIRACTDRGIPVAVQEVAGLLADAAVAELVATLALVAGGPVNPAVAEILAGPRFRLSPADLARLGRRARELAREQGTEASLLDAIADPGPLGGRAGAAAHRLAADVAALRGITGSLVDVVRRTASRVGLDCETYASLAESAPQVRAFFAHVAEYAATHPDAGLAGLLAYLGAERERGRGPGRVQPGGDDAVAVMTVHQAKGLEWDTVIVAGLADGAFPGSRTEDNPLRCPAALPTAVRSDAAGVPQIGEVTHRSLEAFGEELKVALRRSEDRLCYVAVTRARRRLVVTGHWWDSGRTTPSARSVYLQRAAEAQAPGGDVTLLEGSPGAVNPAARPPEALGWPVADDPRWEAAVGAVRAALDGRATWASAGAPDEVRADVAAWDRLIAAFERADAGDVVDVVVPSPLTVSQLARLGADEQAFAAALARPLPAPVTRRTTLGAQFHDWVAGHYAASPLVGAPPANRALEGLIARFLAGPFAAARPVAVEQDVIVPLAGHVVTGRVDAVFRSADNPGLVPDGKAVLIVDWKTGSTPPDPRQLAVYARAWARRAGLPLEAVAAGFYHVAENRLALVDVTADTSAALLRGYTGLGVGDDELD